MPVGLDRPSGIAISADYLTITAMGNGRHPTPC